MTRDFSRLEEPDFYNGKATRPSGDREVIDPQPVHLFQAHHPEPAKLAAPRGALRALAAAHGTTLALVAFLVLVALVPSIADRFASLGDGTPARYRAVLVLGLIAGGGTAWCLFQLGIIRRRTS